jgi:hypothetical protein
MNLIILDIVFLSAVAFIVVISLAAIIEASKNDYEQKND